MDFEKEVNFYMSKQESLGLKPTITGLAYYLEIPSKTLMNMTVDDDHYNFMQLTIDRIASYHEAKMDPNKWMNIVAKWIAVERQEVSNQGGLNIRINADRDNNL